MLVLVPINVQQPPKMEAYETGIRIFEEDTQSQGGNRFSASEGVLSCLNETIAVWAVGGNVSHNIYRYVS